MTYVIEEVDINFLENIAHIAGGGAALALTKYNQLKANGQSPALYLDRENQRWIVKHDGKDIEYSSDDGR